MVLDGYVKQDIGETRMKRVLVLSDSHGNVGNMIRAVKREEPDMILHLGDCVVDADALRREFPHITMVNVPGNCDFSRGDTERLIDIDGYKVLMCHGHTYGVSCHICIWSFMRRKSGQTWLSLAIHTSCFMISTMVLR